MDSLMAVELRRRLEKDLGSSLPATLAMDRPTIGEAVDYLLGDVLGLSTDHGTAGRQGPADLNGKSDEVSNLDDSQVDALLKERLSELLEE
jgi:hypothetical protein